MAEHTTEVHDAVRNVAGPVYVGFDGWGQLAWDTDPDVEIDVVLTIPGPHTGRALVEAWTEIAQLALDVDVPEED